MSLWAPQLWELPTLLKRLDKEASRSYPEIWPAWHALGNETYMGASHLQSEGGANANYKLGITSVVKTLDP